ncbi:MAG: hypothetical protein ACRCXX_14460 [Cetobacterium sp.]|uniref:hypothetical protein n=1 Tax=Cetobacterium sp. TaxID=2071632 RepID=UPI003F3BB615
MKDKISKSISEKKIVEVPLETISSIDVNPRKGGLVLENVEALVASGDFPEIHLGLFDGDLIVVDGYHRLAATHKLERDKINAFIIEYKTMTELKKQAFVSNVNHGIKLSQLDIALNIYEFYIEAIKTKTSAKLKDVIKEYQVQERTGRQLFYWALFNRSILENKSIDMSGLTRYEDYNKLLIWKNENIADISEEFKIFFKEFYEKYDKLPTTNRRAAIDLHMEGKEFFEEEKKQQEHVDEINQKDREAAFLDKDEIGEDEIDRQGISGGATGAITSGENPNKVMENLDEEYSGEINQDREVKPKKEKKESISNTIMDIHQKSAAIKMHTIKGHIAWSKDDYETLQSIIDNLSETVSQIDSSSFYGDKI